MDLVHLSIMARLVQLNKQFSNCSIEFFIKSNIYLHYNVRGLSSHPLSKLIEFRCFVEGFLVLNS